LKIAEVRKMVRPSLLLAVFAFTATAGSAVSPDPKDLVISAAEISRARELVAKLGSEDYDEREEAQENLAKMGRLAMPALVDGMNTIPSPEVRFRCQALLPKAAHEDLQARLATFLEDADGKYEHDLAGWNEFRKVVGNSIAASRSTFVELLKDPPNRALVLAVSGTPSELGSLVAGRKQEIYQQRFPRKPNAVRKEQSVPDVIALMFAESHVESKQVPRIISNATVYNMPGLAQAISDGSAKAAVYRAVVGHWIETRDEASSMYTAMNQATTLGLKKQGNTVAAKLVRFKGGIVNYRLYAAFALARNGAKDHLADLEAVVADEAALGMPLAVNGVVQVNQIQMRDMALVAALLITGQDTEGYGFIELHKNRPGMQFTYANWRLPDDKRKKAFEKWKAWREKNPDYGKNVEEEK
jgi:hypothetical protein